MRLSRKFILISCLVVVVLLAALLLGLPPLVRHLAIQNISESTGRKAEIAKVSLNPFTLSAGISGFRLSEKQGGATFLSFSSARLSLSPLSLPKRSFIVTELDIASPYLHTVRYAPNTFNFSDLLTSKGPEKKKEGSYLFSLNNITVSNGSLDFQDKALREEKDHRITGINLSVPFVSNMPYLADRYVNPHFSAVVNGTPVAFDGRLKPLTRAVEASIDLKVRQLDLPFYLGYVPVPLPVQVNSGKFTSDVTLGYRVDAKTGPETTLAGSLALDQLALREPGGAPLVGLRRARLGIGKAELMARRVQLSSLDLDGLELTAAKDAAGRWNFQKLVTSPRHEAAPAVKQQAPGRPITLTLAKLSLNGGQVHLSDATAKGGFRTDLKDIDLTVAEFATAPGHRAPFTLKLASARRETLGIKGDLTPQPLEVRATLALAGVPLKDYYPYLAETLTAPVSGTLAVASELFYNEALGLVLDKTSLRGANLAAPFGAGEGIQLKETLASGIKVDVNRKQASVASVDIKGGKLALSREKDGSFSVERLLRRTPAATKGAGTKAAARKGTAPVKGARPGPTGHAAAQQGPFSYRISRVTGSDLAIRFTDRTLEEAPLFTLSRMKFTLAGLAGPKQGPIPFTLATGYGAKGQINASGVATLAPMRLKGHLELRRIALRDFDAYIPDETAIFLADGALDTELSFNLAQAPTGVQGSFDGSLGVRSFYCLDSELDEDLLKWESLQLDRIKGTLGPLTLAISDVSLNNFYARVIVEQDGSLNLQHLMGQEPAPASPAPVAAVSKPAPKAAAVMAPVSAPPPPARAGAAKIPATAPAAQAPAAQKAIRIDTVSVQGGTVDFSDRHLKYPFDTTFYNLGGRVTGLSSETNRAADVDLRGNLENHSPLSIYGAINPLRGDLFLDLKIAFTDIELSPFTPYSNTYLGYTVDKGKLSLDLMYKIDKKALTSQNKLFIDQFTFGKQVQSDKATKLPVRLAVALLKDRKGEIHLDLPVVGQTNDPKFSVWGVVLQMLKNLLVKAATSPFALLGSMFGSGEDFSAVTFAPGSAQLSLTEQDKLLKLARAMLDRPALNMEISGFVDRERDPEGYRNELLTKKMKSEKFRKLVKEGKIAEGQGQDSVELLPQEYPAYLKAVYVKEKFPKPRNALGFLKDLPDAEMRKLILTHTVVGDNDLRTLARERAETVRAFLRKNGKIPTERIFEKNADIFTPSSKAGTGGSRVEFGASVK